MYRDSNHMHGGVDLINGYISLATFNVTFSGTRGELQSDYIRSLLQV